MKAMILSDLHFEFMPDNGKAFVDALPTDCDVAILAGDICVLKTNSREGVNYLCQKFPKVIYVLGNHEFYKGNNYATQARIKELLDKNKNLTVLDNAVEEFGGKRFIGSTLWFPPSPETIDGQDYFSDFIAILEYPNWFYERSADALQFLRKEVKPGDVVITHHIPSDECVAPRWIGDPFNCFFVGGAGDIFDLNPSMWIFGHSHFPMDKVIKNTRIINNARGYTQHKEHISWQPKVIDI